MLFTLSVGAATARDMGDRFTTMASALHQVFRGVADDLEDELDDLTPTLKPWRDPGGPQDGGAEEVACLPQAHLRTADGEAVGTVVGCIDCV